MSGYHLTFRDWLGGGAIALPLALLAWQAGAWLWRQTGRLFPGDAGRPASPRTDNEDQEKD